MFRNKALFGPACGSLLITYCLMLFSCTTIDLYEKVVPIPKHQWQSSYKPEFTFSINDTSVPYQLYVILRHNNKYKYNNIWVNIYAKAPADTVQKFARELPLASKDGWLGTGMDDIFDHRITVFAKDENFYFRKTGEYTFVLEQIMRDDPLADVMNVGIRIEKKLQ
jgi:gliding motility-associated lipoprotein GldH